MACVRILRMPFLFCRIPTYFVPSGGWPAGVPRDEFPVNHNFAIINGLHRHRVPLRFLASPASGLPAATCAAFSTIFSPSIPHQSAECIYTSITLKTWRPVSVRLGSYFRLWPPSSIRSTPTIPFFSHTHLDHDKEQPRCSAASTGSPRRSVLTYDQYPPRRMFHHLAPTRKMNSGCNGLQQIQRHPTVSRGIGLDISGFANLGPHFFAEPDHPSPAGSRRQSHPEFVDITTCASATMHLIAQHTQSNTFFPGRFDSAHWPGGISALLAGSGGLWLAAVVKPCDDHISSVSLGLPQFSQQGFATRLHYTRPFVPATLQHLADPSESHIHVLLALRVDAHPAPSPRQGKFRPACFSFAWIHSMTTRL